MWRAKDLAIIHSRDFFILLEKENVLYCIKLITKWIAAHQRTKQRHKMCQLNPSMWGGFQGSCVGVLCRLAEWEERQVNTWCQRERRSPYLSFFLPHSAGEICLGVCQFACAHLSARLLAFCTFVCVYFFKGVRAYVCLCSGSTLNPHQTKCRSKGELKRAPWASKAIKESEEGLEESQKFSTVCRQLQKLQLIRQWCIAMWKERLVASICIQMETEQ